MNKKISIVITFFNESGNINSLFEELQKVLDKDFSDWEHELVMVDDGSVDNTWNELVEIKQKNNKIKLIRLNRNYGQSIAMDAGFKNIDGDIVVTMDGDLQNDHKDIKRLYDKLEKDSLDLVAGNRKQRKDPLSVRIITFVAKFLRKLLIKDGVEDSGCTLRIYRKKVTDNLNLRAEIHRYIVAISKINGFKVGEICVNHRVRENGVSKYNWKKSIKGFIDLFYIWFIGKYESRPLHFFGTVGIVNFIVGVIFFFVAFYQKIIMDVSLNRSGWLFLGIFLVQVGIIIFIFGIMIDIMIRNYYNNSYEKRYIIKDIL
ncbi:glycosyltransferase family 2 protein [Candidatus Absconditicoccus praedator]|uniref:glycosyltransferase family 2 protein n=1 Tax=Candidatus Absconditicoccus praedator TaxID=2735562 RepID=UPI001E3AA0BA|nr:glycosyltransferase family 2 protein [Candidatus Absconditicoccus praedator]UFX83183.1 glycosyltransferase family 2 protein [Candidatus Absconditicoccus praedator]